MSQLTQLLAVAALAGGLYAVAGQPARAPKPGAPEVAAVAKPAPIARSTDHRKVHRPTPKVAKRKWEPIPGARPIPPIAKEEKRRERPKAKIVSKRMPSCTVVRREYERMTMAQKLARYTTASAEEVAYGRRCLGL